MNFSRTFIQRPIATSLLMLGIALFGIMAYRALPVSDLPQVDFPTLTSARACPAPTRPRWPRRSRRRSSASSRPSPASIR